MSPTATIRKPTTEQTPASHRQACVAAGLTLLCTCPIAAAEMPLMSSDGLSVLCVDGEGEPVVGAEVHLYQNTGGEDGRYVHAGPFMSDEEGRAVFPEAIFSDSMGQYDRWMYARVPGRMVGVARSAKWKNRQEFNVMNQVKLFPSRRVEGTVAVPSGFDPSRVTVRVQVMHITSGAEDFDYDSFPRDDTFPGLDSSLPEVFETRPDAKGQFRFDDIPQRGRLYLVTQAEGLGQAQWRNEDGVFDNSIELTLVREGVVSGQIVTPEGAPAVGMKVNVRLAHGGRIDGPYLYSFRTETDKQGNFKVAGMPHTEFVVYVEDPTQQWTFRPQEDLLAEPGEPLELDLRMEDGVIVTGRVFGPDGKPIEGAAISAVTDTRIGSGLDHDSTDIDGQFELRLPAGVARLYFNALPPGFAYPRPQIVKELDIELGQSGIDDVDLYLERQ